MVGLIAVLRESCILTGVSRWASYRFLQAILRQNPPTNRVRSAKMHIKIARESMHICLSFCIVQGVFTRRLMFVQLFVCHAAI